MRTILLLTIVAIGVGGCAHARTSPPSPLPCMGPGSRQAAVAASLYHAIASGHPSWVAQRERWGLVPADTASVVLETSPEVCREAARLFGASVGWRADSLAVVNIGRVRGITPVRNPPPGVAAMIGPATPHVIVSRNFRRRIEILWY